MAKDGLLLLAVNLARENLMGIRHFAALAAGAFSLCACSQLPLSEPTGVPMKHTVFGVTGTGELIKFNAGTPRQIDARVPISGLQPDERLVGIDFRVARGVLFGLTSSGRLVTINTTSGEARQVGTATPLALNEQPIGFDFNPAADRIRVVAADGRNMRLHPETGALAATDPALSYAGSQAAARQVIAAAYTYNKDNGKLTTNYAIDAGRGWLMTQGSIEGREPVVSPNTGRLFDVGALGTGPVEDAAFDIADIDNTALAALRVAGRTRLYTIDLSSGKAQSLGSVADGRPLLGLAIEP